VSNILKKTLIIVLLAIVSFTTVRALEVGVFTSQNGNGNSNYDFIEDAKLASSRYTKPDDLSLVDPSLFISLTNRDDLIASNDDFELYFNDNDVLFKVLDKQTGYVWSTAMDNASDAGTYQGLLESSIGIEYIKPEKDMFIEENVGINDTELTYDITPIEDGVKLSFSIGGYCDNRTCSRAYESKYLTGEVTLEEMIEDYRFSLIGISFDIEVCLTETGLDIYIPVDSITEEYPEEIVLSSIVVFPALGATKTTEETDDLEIPGYMVIPDGSGALIRYEDNQGQFKAPFEERFYGSNFGLEDFKTSVTSYPLSMPIFGAVHGVNQNAFIGIIESGDFSSRLFAYPNGAHNLPYNLIFPKFDIKQVYRQAFSSDGSNGVLKYIQSSYDDIEVKYNFLNNDDANYVGIGKNYRDYLMSDEVAALSNQNSTGDIPLSTTYLMSDTESSFFGASLVEMSTVKQVRDMYDYFLEQGIDNQKVSLMGWNENGYSGELPAKIDYENSLGSNRSYRELISYINEQNTVNLINNYVFATNSTSRISFRNDVAKGIDKFKIEYECEDCVHNELYLLYPYVSASLANKDSQDYLDNSVGVLFESLGNNLTAYYEGDNYFRMDSYLDYQEAMETYQGVGSYVYPYSYAYKYTSDFYHAPLYNSQLKYYDDVVPLLQIVLKGSIEMYSSYLNFNSLGKETILNLIDFGMNPSYILTYEPSSNLKDTDIAYFYTTEFDLWKESVQEEYDYINNALKYVNGESITSRVVLDYGIVEVTYSNGVNIYINYTSNDYVVNDITIPSMDYYLGGVN
jgi:hypothetical protein